MDSVFGLLLLLLLQLQLSHGVETFCDGRRDGAQCYGPLGGTLVLLLRDSTSDIFKYQWLNKTSVILNGRKDRIVYNLFKNRSSFTPTNGTFRINSLKKTDEGEYAFETFNSHGYKTAHLTQQFALQAPVSSVQLVSKCLSKGEMRVSCSSEGGDSPQYSWTLDGNTVTDTQLLSGSNNTTNITLKEDVLGRLVCSVSNNVSRISVCCFKYVNCTFPNGTYIPHWAINSTSDLCIEPATPNSIHFEDPSLVCDLLAAVVIMVVIGIAVHFCWNKKKIKEAKDAPGPEIVDSQNGSVLVVESSELFLT